MEVSSQEWFDLPRVYLLMALSLGQGAIGQSWEEMDQDNAAALWETQEESQLKNKN